MSGAYLTPRFHKRDRDGRTISELRAQVERAARSATDQVRQDIAGQDLRAKGKAGDVVAAIVRELKRNGRFTLPSFGTFSVRKTKPRNGPDPRSGKTVRFKPSPALKRDV
jgi:DNA-binding protein HU-beta